MPTIRFPRVQDVASLPDPQMSHRIEAIFPTLRGYTPIVETADLPFPIIESEGVKQGLITYQYPTSFKAPALQVEFYCDIAMNIVEYIRYWRSLVVDETNGLANFPRYYKKNICFYYFGGRNRALFDMNVEGSRALSVLAVGLPLWKFQYIGCWPEQTTDFKMTSGVPDRVTLKQRFNVDMIQITPIAAGRIAENTFIMNSNFLYEQAIGAAYNAGELLA